jgi:hypothetical protein
VGDYERAIEQFAVTLRLDPMLVAAQFEMALSLNAVGRKTEAITYWKSVALSSDNTCSEKAKSILATLR